MTWNADRPRRLVRPIHRAAEISTSLMSSVAMGSFAYVGRELTEQVPAIPSRLFVAVEVGEACQLACRHCIYRRDSVPAPRPNSLVFGSLERALQAGLQPIWVSLAGKEPTLFPDELLRFAKIAHSPDRITIVMTNGLRLSEPLLAGLTPFVDLFDVSVDGDEDAHDWMRGAGTFRRTWANLEGILASSYPVSIGLIATAVHATLAGGQRQTDDIVRLARRMQREFGQNARISLSVSLYYGPPGDPFLLTAEDLYVLIDAIAAVDADTRILLTANYAHLWPDICRRLGWDSQRVAFDVATGIPVLERGRLRVLLFNLSHTLQLALRLSNDGLVFLGCNHLSLGERGPLVAVGDLRQDDLVSLGAHLLARGHQAINSLDWVPEDCLRCPEWSACRAGDRLSGLYLDGVPADPYCTKIALQ